jgi:four helix bundle protein
MRHPVSRCPGTRSRACGIGRCRADGRALARPSANERSPARIACTSCELCQVYQSQELRGLMSVVRSYRDLEVWQLSIEVVQLVYHLSADFPPDERYGLTAQMRRAAVSVPSNIAEGHARRSLRAYLNHLGIALGSLGELDTELEIAARLRFCEGARGRAPGSHGPDETNRSRPPTFARATAVRLIRNGCNDSGARNARVYVGSGASGSCWYSR